MSANYQYIQTLQRLGRASAEVTILRVMLRYQGIQARIVALQAEITKVAYDKKPNPVSNREALRILHLKLDAWEAEENKLSDEETKRLNPNSNLSQFLNRNH